VFIESPESWLIFKKASQIYTPQSRVHLRYTWSKFGLDRSTSTDDTHNHKLVIPL